MEVINKYELQELAFPIDGIYKYFVQRLTSVDGGKTFAFCGYGKYCRTQEEAAAYKKEMEAKEPKPKQARKKSVTIADGLYYYMDCMNAFVNDGLFKVSEFTDEGDAIQTAANYEATLYLFEYRDGERVSSKVIYQPQFL